MEGEKNPKVLFKRFRSGKIDNKTLFDSLISLIENSDDRVVRVESIELLNELDSGDPRLFKIFQDLLISDLDEDVRSISAKLLVSKFFKESVGVLEWAIRNEPSLKILAEILEGSKLREKNWLTLILVNIFKELITKNDVEKSNIKYYISSIKNLFSNKGFETLRTEELMEMYLNYRVLVGLENRFQLSTNLCECFSKDGYLDELNLGGINLKSILEIEGLDKLLKLESLDLIDTQLKEITGLEKLKELRSLILAWNQIERIDGLEFLKKLTYLDLSENKIREINGLESLVNLKELLFFNNKIKRIYGLETLVNLEFLSLDDNDIREMAGFHNLCNLKVLSLNHNQISEIKKLQNLTKLQRLDLKDNRIKEIKGLKKLKLLKNLDLEDNEISSVKLFKKLKKLDSLYINGNDIPDEELLSFSRWFEKKVMKRRIKDYKSLTKSSKKFSSNKT